MSTETFYIQSHFYTTLKNGFRDDINSNPEILGFILGAIDNGFSVKMPGAIIAKYGKVEIYCWRSGEKVVCFLGREKKFEMTLGKGGFMWDDIEIKKGYLFIDNKLICKTS